MKKIILLVFFVPIQVLSQKTFSEIIQKGEEKGITRTCTFYKDSVVYVDSLDKEHIWRYTANKEFLNKRFTIKNDSLYRGMLYYNPKPKSKIEKAEYQWELAFIKERFPDYYNKWFKKK